MECGLGLIYNIYLKDVQPNPDFEIFKKLNGDTPQNFLIQTVHSLYTLTATRGHFDALKMACKKLNNKKPVRCHLGTLKKYIEHAYDSYGTISIPRYIHLAQKTEFFFRRQYEEVNPSGREDKLKTVSIPAISKEVQKDISFEVTKKAIHQDSDNLQALSHATSDSIKERQAKISQSISKLQEHFFKLENIVSSSSYSYFKEKVKNNEIVTLINAEIISDKFKKENVDEGLFEIICHLDISDAIDESFVILERVLALKEEATIFYKVNNEKHQKDLEFAKISFTKYKEVWDALILDIQKLNIARSREICLYKRALKKIKEQLNALDELHSSDPKKIGEIGDLKELHEIIQAFLLTKKILLSSIWKQINFRVGGKYEAANAIQNIFDLFEQQGFFSKTPFTKTPYVDQKVISVEDLQKLDEKEKTKDKEEKLS